MNSNHLEQRRRARLEQIGWASKFSEEQNNAAKKDWMQAYVELVDAVAAWSELCERFEVTELLEELNQVDFLPELSPGQLELIGSESLMEEPLARFESSRLSYISASEIKTIVGRCNELHRVMELLPSSGRFDFYDSFENVNPGPAVLYTVDLPPSNFEGTDTLTFVISIPKRKVMHLIGHNGFPIWLDEAREDFTKEELEDLGLDVME